MTKRRRNEITYVLVPGFTDKINNAAGSMAAFSRASEMPLSTLNKVLRRGRCRVSTAREIAAAYACLASISPDGALAALFDHPSVALARAMRATPADHSPT